MAEASIRIPPPSGVNAAGLTPPPGRRGSLPSSVQYTVPAGAATATVVPAATTPPACSAGRAVNWVSIHAARRTSQVRRWSSSPSHPTNAESGPPLGATSGHRSTFRGCPSANRAASPSTRATRLASLNSPSRNDCQRSIHFCQKSGSWNNRPQ